MFSKLLKDLRMKHRISQFELARALGTTSGHISDWETGKAKPSFSTIVALARYFGVSADYLLELDSPKETTQDKLNRLKNKEGLTGGKIKLTSCEIDMITILRNLPADQQLDLINFAYYKFNQYINI